MEKNAECILCRKSANFSSRSIQYNKQDEKGDGCATKAIVICSKCEEFLNPKKGSFCTSCEKPADLKYLKCKRCQKVYHYYCVGIEKPKYDEMTEENKKDWTCKPCFMERLKSYGIKAGRNISEIGYCEQEVVLKADDFLKRKLKQGLEIENNQNSFINDCREHLAITAGLTGAGIIGFPLVLGAAGFGAAGVSAGSAAAVWQSAIGNVASGSLFATFQSVGAAGLSTFTQAGIFAFSSVIPFFGKRTQK